MSQVLNGTGDPASQVVGRRDPGAPTTVDALVVGAGFSGLYALYRLRAAGLSVIAVEDGDDVGGTWYWNRYPGARCDVPTTDYCYRFDPQLEWDWQWSEKYATQPEILAYLRHVTERHGLRPLIRFSTTVVAATWDASDARWVVLTEGGDRVDCRFLVMAGGCLSRPKPIDIPGAERFRGPTYHTARWPHEGVDFTGRRVGVIGTGSSGIQAIPRIAEQAASLTVFQRTPNFSMPALNGPPPPERVAALADDRDGYRQAALQSHFGVPDLRAGVSILSLSEEERRARFDEAWAAGELFALGEAFSDTGADLRANGLVTEMFHQKIRSIVRDPKTAAALCPTTYPYGTKRPCLDSGYFETFNLDHVRLVDVRTDPIVAVTETGVQTASATFELDDLVFATGFDAVSGPFLSVDVTGRDGARLADAWADGPATYLGLMVHGFPNLFTVTGPGSPSVLTNMVVSIEQHVDWITACIEHLRAEGLDRIEPTVTAQAGWTQHVNDWAELTLLPLADSWWMGANVPGKPRRLLAFVGGIPAYVQACDEVVERDYLGFHRAGPAGDRCRDGVVRRLRPDVAMVQEAVDAMGLPPIETMGVEQAREMQQAGSAARPPGPEVASVEDGTLPGAHGELRYRLWRPDVGGPLPVLCYFHGGGYVLGGPDSDEPLCRDLCVRTGALVVSIDYHHAPEHRFPAAADDGVAALSWLASAAPALGGDPARLVVGGWSAGATVATVAARLHRDARAPLAGQLLLCPLADCRTVRESHRQFADGYVLTTAMLNWFLDLAVDPADRDDPRASPLRATDLAGMPPTVVMTAEADPLHDEGVAYAEALRAAGVGVRHIEARGHTHVSWTMVDVVPSGAAVRATIAGAVSELLSVPATATSR